ncbi:MAG TPA: adenylate/guanylate cyclase domain-containing protein, partial [Saprospiraceae bacterium]|nr:adenylate/guanylate cyclase domain-containing protein [Saprospiraceae bacterium]
MRVAQATQLDNMGLSDSALVQLYWAQRHYTPACDSLVLMSIYRTLASVLISLQELERCDSICRTALSLWNPAWKNKRIRLGLLTNLGITQATVGHNREADSLFHTALHEAQEVHEIEYVQNSFINLGGLKGMTGDLDSAHYFFMEAAYWCRQEKNPDNYMAVLINLANIDAEKGKYVLAENLLDSAYALAISLKSTEKLAKVQRARADMFALAHDYKQAFAFLDDYILQHDKFLNEERVKAVNELMEKYESEKKAHQIQKLKLENLDATLQNERIRNTRNRYLFAGIGIFLLAIGLYSRLHYVRKSRRAIQHEKDISEGLLLNILPAAVAEELKIKGNAEARHFDQATILFSDFKGFTTIAENLSASDLVGELNVCFKAFDEIITRHGI